MNKRLHKGNIVLYTDCDGNIKKGVLIVNNSCLLFSSTFQIVPIEKNLKTGYSKANAKKEFLINRNNINRIIGKVNRKVLYEIEQDIINHHLVETNDIYKIGEVYLADIPKSEGSIQCGKRPVLIVSNEIIEEEIHIIPLTTKLKKQNLPTHLTISAEETFLQKDSMVLVESEMPIKTEYLIEKIGKFNNDIMQKVLKIIKIQHNIV